MNGNAVSRSGRFGTTATRITVGCTLSINCLLDEWVRADSRHSVCRNSFIRHKLLLKCSKNYYIWSRHLQDISKNMHRPHFFGPPGNVNYVLCINCCHRHWTLTLSSFNTMMFTVHYSLYQSSFCCHTK